MGKDILLIGDSCEDIFVYGECKRLNPEAPTPVFTPYKTTRNQGMAGNVLNNLKHLGMGCDLITNEEKIQKIRYVDRVSNYILLRVDNDSSDIEPLCGEVDVSKYSCVVISDYDKGFLDIDFLVKLFKLCKDKNVVTFMDTKKKIGDWVRNCDYIKINHKEFKDNVDVGTFNDMGGKFIITMGSEGCQYLGDTYPAKKVNVLDRDWETPYG